MQGNGKSRQTYRSREHVVEAPKQNKIMRALSEQLRGVGVVFDSYALLDDRPGDSRKYSGATSYVFPYAESLVFGKGWRKMRESSSSRFNFGVSPILEFDSFCILWDMVSV